MTRRVVVTGTGVISPIGNDVKTYWKNLLEGACGIDLITSIPTEDLPVKIAGEVKDFTPADYEIETPFARKQDKFTLYAVAAAWQAVKESGLKSGEDGNIDSFRFGDERVTNFEMEGSAIAGIAAHLGHNAGTVCCIIAHRHHKASNPDYKQQVRKLIELCLDRLAE